MPRRFMAFLALAATVVRATITFSAEHKATDHSVYQVIEVFPVLDHSDPVTDAQSRQTLIANAAAISGDELYVSLYSSRQSSAGRQMYSDSDIASLVSLKRIKRGSMSPPHTATTGGKFGRWMLPLFLSAQAND
jgi:hypothetical protein